MGSLRRFTCDDLLRFNNINLDVLTETYNMQFYLQYLATWPEYFMVEEAPHGQQLTSYIMGKAEGKGELWHGHVTAVTVAPEYRRLGRAKTLMDLLEEVSERDYNAYFVDLFVRVSNSLAINMYNKFGYTVFRRVIGYYSGDDEDAFDMRKALPRDRDKKSVIPMTRPIYPNELECFIYHKTMFHHVPSHMLTPDYGRHLLHGPHAHLPTTGLPMHLDVKETAKDYRICCDLPGVEKDKIDVSVDDRVLTITAERTEAKDMDNENTHISERRHGKSSRSLRLPPDANEDAIRAQHENGVLRVCIDKKERHESTARPIQITHDYPFCK